MIHSQFSKLTFIICISLSLCLSACNNDNDLADIPTNNIEPLVGIWQAPGESTFVDSKKSAADNAEFARHSKLHLNCT